MRITRQQIQPIQGGSPIRGYVDAHSGGSQVWPSSGGIAVYSGNNTWSSSIVDSSHYWIMPYHWGNWASNFGTTSGKIAQGNDSRVNNGQTAYNWTSSNGGNVLLNNTGRSGGSTLLGGTGASETLTLASTSHATKGKILFGTSAYDEANNYLGINTLTPLGRLQVVETSTASPRGIISAQISDNSSSARMCMMKARGTVATPTTVVSGDNLGHLVFRGYDGSTYQEMGSIVVSATGTIGANRVPTNMKFYTATDAGPSVLTLGATLDQSQNFTLAGAYLSPTFADATDATKKANFILSGITTGNNRNITIPNHDYTGDNITTSTTTNLTGVLIGNGSTVSASLFYVKQTGLTLTNGVVDLSRQWSSYVSYTLTGNLTLSIANGSVVGGQAEGIIVGDGTHSITLSGITLDPKSDAFSTTNGASNRFVIINYDDAIYIRWTNL